MDEPAMDELAINRVVHRLQVSTGVKVTGMGEPFGPLYWLRSIPMNTCIKNDKASVGRVEKVPSKDERKQKQSAALHIIQLALLIHKGDSIAGKFKQICCMIVCILDYKHVC
jgi:hypothetical protein